MTPYFCNMNSERELVAWAKYSYKSLCCGLKVAASSQTSCSALCQKKIGKLSST
jgi:hypothetical protein